MNSIELHNSVLLKGCALASRTYSIAPSLSIALVERGSNEREHPYITNPLAAAQLPTTELVVDYQTEPQPQVDNRRITNYASRSLSGSSGVNYGAWIRGPAVDYDLWAQYMKDDRWSYRKFLPYFRRTEHYHDPDADSHQHGFERPIYTTSGREYPLRESVHQAFVEAIYIDVSDLNGGHPLGLAQWTDN